MTTLFGRFEIQSELSKSETALIYKAMDLKANQVVALKTQSLEPLGERADAFVDTLLAEGESTRDLVSQNIVALYGAGEVDGQFCAAMEYIQGNSIATMLERNEGFSIWDLLDITRQVCAGLEQAAAKGVTHCSLEPAKIMVQWDGLVKILGYGISNMSLIAAESGKGLGPLLSYCSPEQIRGEAVDPRSNLFTLGAILYEMAVGRKAFEGADPVALVNQIELEMPAKPLSVNAKIHPLLSELIMKALAKDPAERYQSSRELLEDLEQCKESGKKAAAADTKKPALATSAAVSSARAAASSKFVSSGASAAAPVPSDRPAVGNKASAAVAGAANGAGVSVAPNASGPDARSNHNSNTGARLISDFEVNASETQAPRGPVLSASPAELGTVRPTPRVAADPVMSGAAAASSGTRFSDLAEMPPLKEPVFAPSVPESVDPPTVVQVFPRRSAENEDKARIQPREIAERAFQQIATVPPRLILFSVLGAMGLILLIAIAVLLHVRSEDDGATAAPKKITAAGPDSTPGPKPPIAHTLAPPRKPAPQVAEAQSRLAARPAEKRKSKNAPREPVPAPAPVVILGAAMIDSSPQGASFQVDGKNDPSWVTPFNVTGLTPGKHIISVSKPGYSSDVHSVDVASGNKSSLMLHLSPVNALMVVNSTPVGAEVILDGKPTGRVTPAQFAVEKGSHTVLLRKRGYLDEATLADLAPAQNFQYAPALRALGNTEDMRPLGRFNKLFGRGGESAADLGSIVVRTVPKGAQVAINQQVLERTSPVGVALGPGNYIVDITLTGFKPVHKVVSIDKGNRAAIDEILERQ